VRWQRAGTVSTPLQGQCTWTTTVSTAVALPMNSKLVGPMITSAPRPVRQVSCQDDQLEDERTGASHLQFEVCARPGKLACCVSPRSSVDRHRHAYTTTLSCFAGVQSTHRPTNLAASKSRSGASEGGSRKAHRAVRASIQAPDTRRSDSDGTQASWVREGEVRSALRHAGSGRTAIQLIEARENGAVEKCWTC
jgi:hypothetical protein